MPSVLFSCLQHRDGNALRSALAQSVRFRSPVTDYNGRDDVAHLLDVITGVLGELQPTREVDGPNTLTTFFETEVSGQPLQGVLDEHHDDAGQVVEATLMVRPLAGLQLAVAAMTEALSSEPLPSAKPVRPGQPARGSRTGRPVMVLFDLLGRRWTLRVLWELHVASPRPLTFRALRDRCDEMSSSVLNQRLADLRGAQLIGRDAAGFVLTSTGAELVSLLLPLNALADSWSADLPISERLSPNL